MFAFEHVDMAEFWDQSFDRFTIAIGNNQTFLALGFLTKGNCTGHFRHNCRFLRLSCFKKIGHAW